MDDQHLDQASQDFTNGVENTVKNPMVRKAGHSAGKAVGKLAKKAVMFLLKALKALIAFLGPWLIVLLVVVLLIVTIFMWNNEERGITGNFDLDPENENVLVEDDKGILSAVALSKNQAYTSAFYKYMATSSYQKTVGGPTEFSFRETTSDFAGLQDYEKKENFFYLSPNFIKMADERLNQEEFFYPEQIIKPISYKQENDKVQQVPILDDDGGLAVKSKEWTGDDFSVESTNEVPGVWDYGFGSMLRYDPFIKQKYIDCQYTSYPIDIDRWIETDPILHTGYWSHVRVDIVHIPMGATPEQIMAQYDAVTSSGDPDIRITGPDRATFQAMVDEMHHINMWLEGEDITIGKRTFESAELAPFKNDTEKYPINVPMITSAATFSGDIAYTYQDVTEITDIYDVGDLMAEQSNGSVDGAVTNFSDPAEPINRVLVGTSVCGTEFWCSRVGDVHTITPTQAREDADPVGDTYLKAYSHAYRTYVPKTVYNDYNFAERVEKDPKNNKLLQDLGLIVPYMGVSTDGTNYNVFMPSGLTADELKILLDGTAFDGTETEWVAMEQQYGVNVIFAMSVATLESGFGTSTIARNHNNAFGFLTRNGPMNFSSLMDSVNYFGQLISSSDYYKNKTIDQISVHYCTSGPVHWASTVKQIMSQKYSKLMQNGVSVSAATVLPSMNQISGGEIDPEEVQMALNRSQIEMKDLYQNVNYDVLSSTNLLQKLVPTAADSNGHFGWFGTVFNTLKDLIKNFFQALGSMFTDNFIYEGERLKFGLPLTEAAIDDIVLQTITFSSGTLYTTAYNMVDPEDLGFLFVGKEAMFGFGTGFGNITLVPGVGSTMDGFISPTEDPYTALKGWSSSTGCVELSVPEGTQILSVADHGTVSDIKTNADGSGSTVEVTYRVNNENYKIRYGNLETVHVSLNSSVNKGDLIGISGKRADGTPCLSLSLILPDGRNVDPMDYFYQPTYGNSAIVEVARTQLGNKGGAMYKSWYPLNPVDAWCACFVSWCADQCGFISSGVFPKFASCGYAINNYFKPNHIFYPGRTAGFVPAPGNLIFYDWASGGQDGRADHVGIVEKCENGVVYTIEGNYSNSVKARTVSLNSPEIMGFACPDYQTKMFYQ